MSLLDLYDSLALLEEKEQNKPVCYSLSLFTLNLIPMTRDLSFVHLRRQLAERCVRMSPNTPFPLCQLGWESVRSYEEEDDEEALQEAQLLFNAAWETATVPSPSVPSELEQTAFWKSQTARTNTSAKATKHSSKTSTKIRSKGTSTTRRGGANKSVPRRASLEKSKAPPPKRTSPRRTPPPKSAHGLRTRAPGQQSLPPLAKGQKPPKATTRKTTAKVGRSKPPPTTTPTKAAFLRTNERKPKRKEAVSSPSKAGKESSSTPTVSKPPHDTDSSKAASLLQLVNIKLGLARVAVLRYEKDSNEQNRKNVDEHFGYVLENDPHNYDVYVDYGAFLEACEDGSSAVIALYDRFPFGNEEHPSFDDAYLHGEAIRHIMKQKLLNHSTLKKHLIGLGRALGLRRIESYIDTLDESGKYTNTLKEIYAAVNHKNVDDKDLQPFFKFKCWV
eukprot:m.169482 g.169482  ORF g.169482 m.169482 type:complete len:446 (-) comp13481_c0_seq8:234-1571(-)